MSFEQADHLIYQRHLAAGKRKSSNSLWQYNRNTRPEERRKMMLLLQDEKQDPVGTTTHPCTGGGIVVVGSIDEAWRCVIY